MLPQRYRKAIGDLPDIKRLKLSPLTVVRGLLMWHCKGQPNTLTRNRNRESLPLAKRRKGMTGSLDCVDLMAWPIRSTSV